MTFVTDIGGAAAKLTAAKGAIERGAAIASEVGPLEMEILHPASRESQFAALTKAGAGLRQTVTEFDAGAAGLDDAVGELQRIAKKYPKKGVDLQMVIPTLDGSADKIRAQAAMVRDGMSRGDTLAMWPQHGVLGGVKNDIDLAVMMLETIAPGAPAAAAEDAAKAATMVGGTIR
jgi:hypothetical protein